MYGLCMACEFCKAQLPFCSPSARLFFKTLFHGADSNLLSQHLTVQAERITLLYQTGSFQTEVREVIADQLLEIVRLFPRLLVDHSRDVLDYLGNLWNLSAGGEHCYTHLVRV